jgi:arsenite transporter
LTRHSLAKHQVLVYLAAILLGLATGTAFPASGAILEPALWPVLGVLLYATFTQVPMAHLGEAFADSRFMAAAVVGNFVAIPIVVLVLMAAVPDDPAIRLGVLLVLLVPCTDWFITFAQLGGGDAKRAIAFAPLSLLLQILLLPLYLWVFLGAHLAVTISEGDVLWAFAGLILVPLLAAYLTEKWAEKDKRRAALPERFTWLPVPLLAVVVFIIAASQVGIVMGSGELLLRLLLVFIAFLFVAGMLARLLSTLFRLPVPQGRVLAFSFGTRNSFVVLPLALALPASFELAPVVIVFQILIELFGMAAYLWWIPKRLFPAPS